MNKNYHMLPRLAGLACAILFAGKASAITASTGDLILGFRAASGQGAGLNLEVNIGPASNYCAPASSSFTVPGLSVLDLVSTYGGNWANRSDLSWGVIGTTGTSAVGIAPARTIWASHVETTPGTLSDPWTRASVSGLQNASNAISSMYNGSLGSLGNGSATAGSASASVISTGEPGSWTFQDDLVTGVSFRRFNPTVTGPLNTIPLTPAAYDLVNGYTVIDVWEVRPGVSNDPGTLVGAFGLNRLGGLAFSTNPGVFSPVPEPSAILTTLTLALAATFRRRRTVHA